MATKKRPVLAIRGPEVEPSLAEKDKWVGATETPKTDSVVLPETKPVTKAVKPVNNKKKAPKGAGVVEYSDGTHRRRTTVYLSIEASSKLRLAAALDNTKVNDLICAAIDSWLLTRDDLDR